MAIIGAESLPDYNTRLQQLLAYLRQQRRPIDELRRAYQEAREANERRYQEILAGYRKRYEDAMAALEGMGRQEEADIRSGWQGRESEMMQDVVSRGLAGTTVPSTLRMGVQRGVSADVGRLRERLGQQRLAYQTGLSADTLGFMERREDEYPDLFGYYNLLAQQESVRYPTGFAAPSTAYTRAFQHRPRALAYRWAKPWR